MVIIMGGGGGGSPDPPVPAPPPSDKAAARISTTRPEGESKRKGRASTILRFISDEDERKTLGAGGKLSG